MQIRAVVQKRQILWFFKQKQVKYIRKLQDMEKDKKM